MNHGKVNVRFFTDRKEAYVMKLWDVPIPRLKSYVWLGNERYIVRSLDYGYPDQSFDFTMVDVILEARPLIFDEDGEEIW